MKSEQFNIKFRPKNRKRLIGYTDEELTKIFNNVKGATAVLFYGPTGSGKTTLALMIANEIADPASIVKTNAGDENGIGEVRKMIASSKRKTLTGKKRIFLIDEAHKLTKQAMDALLVPLEEEDPSTIWMLCSNEPERLPPVMMRRLLKIGTPAWTQKRLLRLATRVNKATGAAIPKDLSQFANPSDLLTHMQQPSAINVMDKKGNVATAKYVLHVLLGNPGDRKVNYDFKYSSIMEISLAVRGVLGLTLPYEQPDASMVAMLRKAEPKLVARIANGCAVALRDDTRPPMVLLDVLMGAVAHPYHFEK